MNERRILIRKTADPSSKVHVDAVLCATSSMRPIRAAELSPHSAVLEGLQENRHSGDDRGGGRGHGSVKADCDANTPSYAHSSSGNSLAIDIGFETPEDLESWLSAVQNQVGALL